MPSRPERLGLLVTRLAPFLAGLAALSLVAAVAYGLLRHIPDMARTPLAERSQGPLVPFRVPATAGGDGLLVREIALQSSDARRLAEDDEIRLMVGTFDASPAITRAVLRIDGCTFEAPTGTLQNNSPLRFTRSGPCDAGAAADLLLRVEMGAASAREGQFALWTATAGAGSPPALGVMMDGELRSAVGTRLRRRTSTNVTRIALLSFAWERAEWQVWAVVFVAALLLALGTLGVMAPDPVWRQAFGIGGLAAGLALFYAVLVPPLQAPDEPDHLLSFAKLTRDPALASSTEALARRTHFDRIAFDATQQFGPADMAAPAQAAWNTSEIFAEDVARRASSAALYWRGAAALLPSDADTLLLAMRIANALIFGAAFVFAGLLLVRSGASVPVSLALLPLLVIPTLPFFGMHMSELTWPMFVIILTGAVCLSFALGHAPWWTGLVAGIAVAVVLSGPRNIWPMAGMLGAILGGKVLLAPAERLRGSLGFWLSAAAPALVLFGTDLFTVPTPFYEQWRYEGIAPPGGISNRTVMLAAALAIPLGVAIERLSARFIDRWRDRAAVRWTLIALVAVAAAALVVNASLSLFTPMPLVDFVEKAGSATEYVLSILAAVLTGGRLAQFDYFTWTSFAATFGWLDTPLPPAYAAATTALFLVGAVSLLVLTAWKQDHQRAAWLLLTAAGAVLSVAVYAAATFGMHRNIHGRYLLGPYLVTLIVFGSGFAVASAPGRATGYTLPLLALIAGAHALTLLLLLERYFG